MEKPILIHFGIDAGRNYPYIPKYRNVGIIGSNNAYNSIPITGKENRRNRRKLNRKNANNEKKR